MPKTRFRKEHLRSQKIAAGHLKGRRKEIKMHVCEGDSRLKKSEEIPVLFYTPVLFDIRTSQRLPTKRLKLKNVKNNKEKIK